MMIETVSEARSYCGRQGIYRHSSRSTGTQMTFSVFVPEASRPMPVLWYLSGLSCTHANVTEKGEYRAACARHGVIFVAPDTSPRGEGVPDDPDYDLGQGAGFYVDATQDPWAANYRMWTYIADELPAVIGENFQVDMDRQGITGHSMGGHGALTLALRHPQRFRSVSAFAPIAAPGRVPWGEKAFGQYLGSDRSCWRAQDSVALIEDGARIDEILVDVGTADPFLETELRPELLEAACAEAGIALTLNRREGYDHSYYFISSFMADHVAWHSQRLK